MKCPLCDKETGHPNLHFRETHKLSVAEIKEVWKKIPKRKDLNYNLLSRVFRT